MMSKGCEQRVQALNAFLHDIYHEQHILKAGIIPPEQILTNEHYQAAMQGLRLCHMVFMPILQALIWCVMVMVLIMS
jgi:uncharacterized circularly permuted ATP-grasp superfamily protein